MSSDFEEFIQREADYRAWLAEHPDGFVLNARRNPKASYMQLHTAKCGTVTRYPLHVRADAFTGGDYIKVCADLPDALLPWMALHGARNFSTLCSRCKPDVSSIDQAATQEALLQARARELMATPEQLQQELMEVSSEPPPYFYARTKVFKRSPAVVAAVLLRAKGSCERCRASAPFLRAADKAPYLEVHHKVRLADGGADHPANALALCPNCHREVHFG